MKRFALPAVGILSILLAFFAGYLYGRSAPKAIPDFHDIRVNSTASYTRLVTPDHPDIVALAGQLGTPEAAYYYVRDRIGFEPRLPAVTAAAVLEQGAGSCIGKAVLLCTLFRSMGIPADHVRVMTGQVVAPEGTVDHAWVDMEHEGGCLQLDATYLLGVFPFRAFPGSTFSRSFIGREYFVFNDAGFATVSQLNRFRDDADRNSPPHR